jgi:non-specific protein-tyrosine kinase
MSDFMELHRVISMIIKRWWLLVLLTAIAAGLGFVYSQLQPRVYRATATVLIGQIFQSTSPDRADIQTSEALAESYADIARRQPVLQKVVDALSLEQSWQNLKKQVQVETISGTQLLQIKVEANAPELARILADEVASQLILLSSANLEEGENGGSQGVIRQQILDLEDRMNSGNERIKAISSEIGLLEARIQAFQENDNPTLKNELFQLQNEKIALEGLLTDWGKTYVELLALVEPSQKSNDLSVVESAQASNRPVRPRVLLNTMLAGCLGLILALGLAFLWGYLDDTFKLTDDLYQSKELSILGVIGIIKGNGSSEKLLTHLEIFSPVIESYRRARSKIRLTFIERSMKTILLTSPMQGEGKSITVANLGISLAQGGLKTILVDADLRRPVLHEILNKKYEPGLADLLNTRETKFDRYLQETKIPDLWLLASGRAPQDPPERFGSVRMSQIIKGLEKIADVVIIDSPPALLVADAMVLSNQVDGVILVIQSGKSKWSAVRQALFDIRNTRANYLGSIINKVPKSDTFAVYEKYHRERVSPGWVNNLSSAINGKYRQARGSSRWVDSLLLAEKNEEFTDLDSKDEEPSSEI